MDDQIREANEQSIAEAEAKFDELRNQVVGLKDYARALREEAGTTALSPDDVIHQQENMERQVLELELELDVAQAMRERLSQRIAMEAEEAADKIERDETLAAMRELQALKEEAYKRVMVTVEQGRASAAELGHAKAEVAEQMVRIAERRDMLKNGLGGSTLANLNDRLNDTLHDSDRLQATYQAYSSQLEQMKEKGLLALAEEYESVQQQLHDAERQMRHHAERLLKYKSVVESMLKPQVIVIE